MNSRTWREGARNRDRASSSPGTSTEPPSETTTFSMHSPGGTQKVMNDKNCVVARMGDLSSMDRYKFRRALEEMEKASGRGTELVSVYVPPHRQISDVTNYLRNEDSQSSNVKSAT